MSDLLTEALDYFEQEWELNGAEYLYNAGRHHMLRKVLFVAARAHQNCGTVTDEQVEAAAEAWFNIEAGYLPEDTEFGEELRWVDIDEIPRRDYRAKARAALEAAFWVHKAIDAGLGDTE